MNLKEQLYVCTLANTQNLSVAAKQLYITQPALSLYISHLEKELGTKLFYRENKMFQLTPIGECYVKKAKIMLDLKKEFDLELKSYYQNYDRRIRIGMQEIRSSFLSPFMLEMTMKTFPNVDVILYEGDYKSMEDMLLNNQLDMFFCNYPVEKKEFIHVPICYDELLFIISKNHPKLSDYVYTKSGKFWVDLTQLSDENFILPFKAQSLSYYIQSIFKESEFTPNRTMNVGKIHTIISMVGKNLGVGFCCNSYLSHSIDKDSVIPCHISNKSIKIRFSAIFNKGFKLDDVYSSIIKTLQTNMQESDVK